MLKVGETTRKGEMKVKMKVKVNVEIPNKELQKKMHIVIYDFFTFAPLSDVDVDKPDEKSIMTYVAQFLEKYPDPDKDFPDGDSKVSQTLHNLRFILL